MAHTNSEVSKLLQEHRSSLDDLHRKLAAISGVNKERLGRAFQKLKEAHDKFEDDAQDFVVH